MNLNIKLPTNLFAIDTIGLRDIPCVCKVMLDGDFYVIFNEPLFDASGFMSEFDKKEIDSRFPALTGGSVTQYCNAAISVERINDDKYHVVSLKFFHSLDGWISLIEHGDFVPQDKSKYNGY